MKIYCYNLHNGLILYWDRDTGMYGTREEKDSEYNLPERWFKTMEKAVNEGLREKE